MASHAAGWLGLLVMCRVCAAITVVKQLSACSVQTDEGTIDLTPLAQTTGGPRFDNEYVGLDVFSWNPCVDYTEPGDTGTPAGCGKVAACQKHAQGFYGLGTQSSATFTVNSQNQLEIKYTSAFGSRTAHVQLQCVTPASQAVFTAQGEVVTDNYYMTLSSNYACPSNTNHNGGNDGGLTAGSIIVIAFFIIVALYVIGGALYMRLRRNATGKELIPHYQTWAGVLSSAKDGALFVIRSRKSGYSTI